MRCRRRDALCQRLPCRITHTTTQIKLDNTAHTIYQSHAVFGLPHPPPTANSSSVKALLRRADPPHQKSQSSAFQTATAFLSTIAYPGLILSIFVYRFPQTGNCQRLPAELHPAKHLQSDPFVSDLQSTMCPRCFVHIESGTMPPKCLVPAACSQRACCGLRKPSMSHALSGDRDKELGTHSVTLRRCEVVLIKLHLQVSALRLKAQYSPRIDQTSHDQVRHSHTAFTC
jgi:hypothetical protein